MTAIRIYTRPPVPGATKTRLARSVGDVRAAQLHRAFLEDVIAHARAVPAASVALDVTEDHPLLREIARAHGLGLVVQQDGDLGARMAASLRDALTHDRRALIVGSDAPTLEPSTLVAARDALDEVDVVFAPTPDGGYALIGARVPIALEGVRWSSARTLADSEACVARAGLRSARTSPVLDVDEARDLDLLRVALGLQPHLAAATSGCLGIPPCDRL